MKRIRINPIEEFPSFVALEELQLSVWQFGDRAAVPAHLISVIAKSGGQVLGAYDDRQLVGFSLALLAYAKESREMYLSSYMLAVLPAYQSRSVGFRLKTAQKTGALARGIHRIQWTYDPMLTMNASLNLRKLGATVDGYAEDVYGSLGGALYGGLPTDRFLVTWDLRYGNAPVEFPEVFRERLPFDRFDPRVELDDLSSDEPVVVNVPLGFGEIKKQDIALAERWQLVVRRVSQRLFGLGYLLKSFRVSPDATAGQYLFLRRKNLRSPESGL